MTMSIDVTNTNNTDQQESVCLPVDTADSNLMLTM